MNRLEVQDPDIWSAISQEVERQENGLEMIASENYTSPAVMQAVGSVLTNKYAEGYPGRRYYGGCEFVDIVENLARDRATELFGAEHANVQPHSGSQANAAVYLTAIEPGDTVLGLDLAHGGHLTHGMKLNISGKLYHFVHYGVDPTTHLLDFDQIVSLAREHKPKLIVAGASAYPREIPHARFAEIANEVGARLLVDMAHYAGLVAAGLHDNPVPVADFVTTTTHKTLRGPRRRHDSLQAGGFERHRPQLISGNARRPPDARYRRKSSLLSGGTLGRFQTICAKYHRKCKSIGRDAHRGRLTPCQWRY